MSPVNHFSPLNRCLVNNWVDLNINSIYDKRAPGGFHYSDDLRNLELLRIQLLDFKV